MTINSSQKEYANLHTFLTFDEQTHNVRLLICIGAFYFYDSFIYDWIIKKCAVGNKLVALVGGVFLIILFIKSYKKQTEYVKKQVEKYMNEHSSSQ